jgi:signal transduction histidine kinase
MQRANVGAPMRARSDLLIVVALTLGAWALSVAFELHERWVAWSAAHERWQLDELALTLPVLAGALAWFAFRRRNDALTASRAQARAQAQAQALLAHNRRLAQALIAAQDGERASIARELHDELGQACTALRIETTCLRGCADSEGRLAAAARADAAAQALHQGLRGLLHRLRPTSLDSLGLLPALEELCDVWTARSGVVCRLRCAVAAEPVWALEPQTEIAVYRIAQEGLTNAMRHAGARAVRVRLARPTPTLLELTVADDGGGIDLSAPTRGLGLLGARERAAALGGELQLQGRPGAGTRLTLTLPWRERAGTAQATGGASTASALR